MKTASLHPSRSSQALASLPPSLARLVKNIRASARLTPEIVCQCAIEAKVDAQDLLPWADFQHPVADSYGRQLVYHGENFEIMVMSWLPGDFSAIHDHGAAEWGAVQCFGAAEHYTYKLENGLLSTLKRTDYIPNSVKQVDKYLIHQMGNPGKEPFLSLHIYGKDSVEKNITKNSRIFDLFEGSIKLTDGGVFFCLPELQIKQRIYGLRGDAETTLRHHRRMRDRLCQILSFDSDAQTDIKLTILQLEKNIASLDSLNSADNHSENMAGLSLSSKKYI